MTQPYHQGDFQEIFIRNREHTLEKNYQASAEEAARAGEIAEPRPVLDPAIKPVVLPMASGMSCVDGVIRGMRQQKPNLQIACLSDNYFETFATLERMSGKSIDANKPSFASIDVNHIEASVAELNDKGKPADLVFLDLRSSPSTQLESYGIKNIEEITAHLLQGRPKESPLTIALDVTLDKIHSKELHHFLCSQQEAIKEGRLNIVLYRSGHKFDQLGVDKFNAGYMEIYTADQELSENMGKIDGQLTGLDYQALCHFHQNADYEIHQYLKLHYKNTERAYERMSDLSADAGSFLQITPKNDKKLYYVEFTYPQLDKQAANFQCKLMEYASQEAKKRGVQLVQRDSFGFNESSICIISPSKTRLSIDTHPPEQIDQISDIFNEFEDKVQRAVTAVGGKITEENELAFMTELTRLTG